MLNYSLIIAMYAGIPSGVLPKKATRMKRYFACIIEAVVRDPCSHGAQSGSGFPYDCLRRLAGGFLQMLSAVPVAGKSIRGIARLCSQ